MLPSSKLWHRQGEPENIFSVMGITASCQKRLEFDGEGRAVSAAVTHVLVLYCDCPSIHLNTETWLIFYILSKMGVWLTRNRTKHFKSGSPSAKRKSCPAVDFSFAKLKSNAIPRLRETGCPTGALATQAVLIFLNNSLRKYICFQKPWKCMWALREGLLHCELLLGKIHSSGLGRTKHKTKELQVQNPCEGQRQRKYINIIFKTKPSFLWTCQWPHGAYSQNIS